VSAEARLSVTGQRVSNAVVAVGTGTGVAGVMTRRQTQVTAAGLCTGICHCKTHTHNVNTKKYSHHRLGISCKSSIVITTTVSSTNNLYLPLQCYLLYRTNSLSHQLCQSTDVKSYFQHIYS